MRKENGKNWGVKKILTYKQDKYDVMCDVFYISNR